MVHLPENIREDGLLAVVNVGHLLGIIRVGGILDGIDGKHFHQDGAGTGHFQHVMGQVRLCGVDLLLAIVVDILHHVLHGIARTAVLAGKENAEAGADQKPDEADNNNDQHGDQRPGSGNNGFYRPDSSTSRSVGHVGVGSGAKNQLIFSFGILNCSF